MTTVEDPNANYNHVPGRMSIEATASFKRISSMINKPKPVQSSIIAAIDDGGTNPLLENDTEKLYNLACSKKLYDVVKYLESISFGYVKGTPINARSSSSTQRRCKKQTGAKRNSRRKSKTRKARR